MNVPPQLFILLNILGFGLWGFIGKIGMTAMGKYRYLSASYLIVTTIMTFLLLTTDERSQIQPREYLYPIIGGICTGIAVASYFNALERIPLSVVSSLSSLYPLITVLLSMIFFHEKPTGNQGLGILLAIIAGFLLSR